MVKEEGFPTSPETKHHQTYNPR